MMAFETAHFPRGSQITCPHPLHLEDDLEPQATRLEGLAIIGPTDKGNWAVCCFSCGLIATVEEGLVHEWCFNLESPKVRKAARNHLNENGFTAQPS